MPGPSRKKAVFRCDGDARIGVGHVQRCLTLAEALEVQGWSCGFAVCSDAVAMLPALRERASVAILPADRLAEPAALCEVMADGCDLLVVDHYGLARDYESACRSHCGQILVIDDKADRAHDCDVLLDQAPRQAGDYDGLVDAACRRLIGPWYALIRPSFARWRRHTRGRDRGTPLASIAVSFGGSDTRQMTDPTLRAIAEAVPDARVEVFAAGAAYAAGSKALMAKLGLKGEVLDFVDDPARRLAKADLVIGAGGVSVWERCALGLPSLVVQTADNQEQNARALRATAAADVLTLDEARQEGVLTQRISRLAGDGAMRCGMATAAAALCDGRGAQRVAAELDPPTTRFGLPVRLRQATMADCDLILDWQRRPGVRTHFRKPEPPTVEDHRVWMADSLSRGDRVLMMARHGDEDVGLLRLDGEDSGASMEISILVVPESQGAGIGTRMLQLARSIWPDVELIAEVMPDNAPSHAIFKRAGFTWTGQDFRFPAIAGADINCRPARSAQ